MPAVYCWLQSDPQALQSDREPQRLGHQVSPDAIQVLPDLPRPRAPGRAPRRRRLAASANAADAAVAVATVARASAPGQAASSTAGRVARARPARPTLDCAETPPIDDAQFAALKVGARQGAACRPTAVAERRQPQGGAWIVYLGRFADSQAWQQKADELQKLDVKFDRVNTPTDAGARVCRWASSRARPTPPRKLDRAERSTACTAARVVTLTAPDRSCATCRCAPADPAWHHATGRAALQQLPGGSAVQHADRLTGGSARRFPRERAAASLQRPVVSVARRCRRVATRRSSATHARGWRTRGRSSRPATASATSQAGFAAPPPPPPPELPVPLPVDVAAVTVTLTIALLVRPLVGSVTVSCTAPVPAAAPVTTTLEPVVAPSVMKVSPSGIDHW